MAVVIMGYAVVLAALGWLAHRANPESGGGAIITAGISAGLCVIWGLWGLLGNRRRLGAGFTVGLTILALIPQTVGAWARLGDAQAASSLAPLLLTGMLLLSVLVLLYVLHFGDTSTDVAAGSHAVKDHSARPSGDRHKAVPSGGSTARPAARSAVASKSD